MKHLASRPVVPAGAQVQVHPTALPLDLIDLALAVVLAVMLGCGAWSGCWQADAGRESDPSPRWPPGGVPCG